jgi:hypothetical protein
VLVLVGVVGAVLLSGLAAQTAAQRMTLTVRPAAVGDYFARGAVGISLETEELANGDLNADHRSLVALMRQLGPGVLRIGGGSVDSSWWTSDAERPPAWATSVITPTDLGQLKRLLDTTGWHVILSVDLGHFDPTRAADEAKVAARLLGTHLLGFSIGNEPDKFSESVVRLRSSPYTVSVYLKELAEYDTAMRSATAGLRLYGPDLSTPSWLTAVTLDKGIVFNAVTIHYYPTSYSIPKGACRGTPVPSAESLLSVQTRERENAVLRILAAAGVREGSATRISETNTTSSCDYHGGPATSPVFASALWSLDWILRAASSGVSGLNFHGDFGVCAPDTFSPLCEADSGAVATGTEVARPLYYGLYAARQLENGRFVPVEVSGELPSSDFTTYATIHPTGVVTIAVDNFATTGLAPFSLELPAGYRRGEAARLAAPSVEATKGVTFSRATFERSGRLRRTRETLPLMHGAFKFSVPAESAIIVTLRK